MKPSKPSPDFPLFAHGNGQWAKKVAGKLVYYGPWNDPSGALKRYLGSKNELLNVPPATEANKPTRAKGFPLFAHANGQWAKKIRGKIHYFGAWDDPQAALEKWLAEKDALLAGRRPKADKEGLTVSGLINHFLTNRRNRVSSGEIEERTWKDYKTTSDRIIKVFSGSTLVEDLGPDDFERLRKDFASTHALVALGCDITWSRVIFGYANSQFNVAVKYGASFNKPTRSAVRRERKSRPPKLFTDVELRSIVNGVSHQMRAMVLLGINCGFGNNDCARLTEDVLDLDGRWHHFARPKTGIDRRCPLWPETVIAIREALRVRPEPRTVAEKGLVFLTARGNSWARGAKDDSPVSKQFAKVLKRVGLVQKFRGFYSLRHTFQTIGDASGQMVAVQYIMGHAPSNDNMASVYREHTFEQNLLVASNYVRTWLMGNSELHPLPSFQGTASVAEPVPTLRLFVAPGEPSLPTPSPGTEPAPKRRRQR